MTKPRNQQIFAFSLELFMVPSRRRGHGTQLQQQVLLYVERTLESNSMFLFLLSDSCPTRPKKKKKQQ